MIEQLLRKRSSPLKEQIWDAVMLGNEVTLTELLKLANHDDLCFVKENREHYGSKMTALMLASYKNNSKVLVMLLEAGVDADQLSSQVGRSALSYAAIMGHSDIAQILLHWGADADLHYGDNYTPLLYAAAHGHVETMHVLLEGGADVDFQDKFGWTPLMLSSRNGNLEGVQLLLQWKAKVNLQSIVRQTALTDAAGNGYIEIVRLLLTSEAHGDSSDVDGRTALMYACSEGHIKVVKALLEWGIKVNRKDKDGQTALMKAVSKGRTRVVKKLLEWGAKINYADNSGWTALMLAAHNGHVDIVQLLLEYGADKTIRNKDGRSAAKLGSSREISTMIRSFGVPTPTPATTRAVSATTTTAVIATEDAGADDPVLPNPTEVAAAECAELEGECDTLGEQVAQAPARRDFMQRRDTLQARFDAATTAADLDIELAGALGESLEAVKLESAQLPLSEEDYLTLAARHAALVQRVEAKGKEFLQAKHFTLAKRLGTKLKALQLLDLTALLSTNDLDPVWVPTSGDPSATTTNPCDGISIGIGTARVEPPPPPRTPSAAELGGLEVDEEQPYPDPSASDPVWVEELELRTVNTAISTSPYKEEEDAVDGVQCVMM